MSGLGSLLWHGPQIRPLIGWILLRVLLHHSTFIGQDRWKVSWLGWCPSPTTGSIVWLQRMASSSTESFITRNPCRVILIESWKFSTVLGFHTFPIPCPGPVTSPYILSFHSFLPTRSLLFPFFTVPSPLAKYISPS